MDQSRGCKDREVGPAVLFAQGARHKEQEQQFDKFTGLESHSGDSETDLGSVRDRAQKQNRSQRSDPQDPIEISPFPEGVEPAPQKRYHHKKQHACKRDQKLFLRFGRIDPCDHDKPYA